MSSWTTGAPKEAGTYWLTCWNNEKGCWRAPAIVRVLRVVETQELVMWPELVPHDERSFFCLPTYPMDRFASADSRWSVIEEPALPESP